MCAARKASQDCLSSPLFEEDCSTVYFNLPKTVWDSVRAPQAVFGDGKSPFEVLLVRARAELMSGDSSKRAAAGQYVLQGY